MYESFNIVSILRMHNTSSLEEMASKNQGYVLREALSDGKIMTSASGQSRTKHLISTLSVLAVSLQSGSSPKEKIPRAVIARKREGALTENRIHEFSCLSKI